MPHNFVPTPSRPVSPHLQVWRWHITMLGSILHRVTGSALYAGAFLIAAWLVALMLGREAYTAFLTLAASPLGILVWIGFSFAAFVHLAGGLRHLLWDMGQGFDPRVANNLTVISLLFSVAATVILWAGLFVSGTVTL